MAKLGRYPEYKDSGVEWLGEIPAHWNLNRAKSLFIKVQLLPNPDDEVVTCFRDGTVTLRKNRRVTGFTESLKEIGYQHVGKGDLVIHAMDAFAGAIGVSDSDGKCTPVYSICRPIRGDNSYYFAYIAREMSRTGFIVALSKGIRERSTDFRFETFASQPVPVPPTDEQASIVGFLDSVDRRVNRLLRTKRRLIALLNEQKQAIIHHAITKGLNPDASMKPSGIDWLGEIPSHWETLPFVRCTSERADYRGATPEKVDSGVFLVTAKNIRMGWIDYETSKEFIRPESYDVVMRRGLPRLNDLLFTTEAPLGNVALIDREDIALAQRIIRFRIDERKATPQFCLYALRSRYFQTQLEIRATGSTASGIKASKLSQLVIALPAVGEQQEIVLALQRNLINIDTGVSQATREIELIREYRTRLIADVVTGKLDIRNAVLPDDFPGEDDSVEYEFNEGEETGDDEEAGDEEMMESADD